MQVSERTFLLRSIEGNCNGGSGLSLIFTVLCIVDVFGVFPIIALPKPIIDCGFIGLVIIVAVCSMQILTAILLGKCWIIAEKIVPKIYRKNRYPYSALAELTYGKLFSGIVTVLLDVTIFGGGIPNLIVASQNLQLLGLRISGNSIEISYCYWIILLGAILCPVLWLGSPKDMKLLCSISVGLVVMVFSSVTISILLSGSTHITNEPEAVPVLPTWQILLQAYGIIAFQFDIHPTILTIQVDMKEKSKLPVAIIFGFLISLGMFAVITILTAVKFGSRSQLSILETLPTTAALHLAAALIAIQLCLTSAISNNALYQHVEDCMGIPREFNHRRCLLRTILTIFAIVIAESVPRFDIVMSLIGGALMGPLIFIFPPLIYIRMLSFQKDYENELTMESITNITMSGEKSTVGTTADNNFIEDYEVAPLENNTQLGIRPYLILVTIFCIILIIISISLTVVTTYLNVITFIKFTNFSEPCIYNVSSALMNL